MKLRKCKGVTCNASCYVAKSVLKEDLVTTLKKKKKEKISLIVRGVEWKDNFLLFFSLIRYMYIYVYVGYIGFFFVSGRIFVKKDGK